MDVEGHELDVLAGANEMISSGSIEYITFEFGGANIDSRIFFQDYYYFFDHYGYTIYRILPRKGLKKLIHTKKLMKNSEPQTILPLDLKKYRPEFCDVS